MPMLLFHPPTVDTPAVDAPFTPAVVVECAFGYGPLHVAPVWTVVSVGAEVSITRGASSELDDIEAGTANISLIDLDRLYDPTNTDSVYNGLLKPRVPIRVRLLIGTDYYPRFYGFVDEWPVQPAQGNYHNNVTLVCSDAFDILSSRRLPQSVHEYTVLEEVPHSYYGLGEQTGESAADSSPNKYDGTYLGIANRSQPPVLPYLSGKAWATVANDTGYILLPYRSRIDSTPQSIEFWIQRDTSTPWSTFASRFYIYIQGDFNGGVGCESYNLAVGADTLTDQFIILQYIGDAGNISVSWRTDINDGAPHHLALTIPTLLTSGSAIIAMPKLYLDGYEQYVRATAVGGVPPSNNPETNIGGFSSPDWIGRLDDFVRWDVALTQAQIQNHYELGVEPWNLDHGGDRIDRILDLVDWPAALRNLDFGAETLGSAVLDLSYCLKYLRSVARTEVGRLFMSNDGLVTFHDSNRAFIPGRERDVQVIFTDDGTEVSMLDDGGLEFSYGRRFIKNTVTVTREGGQPQTAIDQTSIDDYGPNEYSVDGILARDDRYSRSLAETFVYRYKDPQLRCKSWKVNPERNPMEWRNVLPLELGDRVRLDFTPTRQGVVISEEMIITQITDSGTLGEYTVKFTGSPVDPHEDDYFTWDGTSSQGWGTGVWR